MPSTRCLTIEQVLAEKDRDEFAAAVPACAAARCVGRDASSVRARRIITCCRSRRSAAPGSGSCSGICWPNTSACPNWLHGELGDRTIAVTPACLEFLPSTTAIRIGPRPTPSTRIEASTRARSVILMIRDLRDAAVSNYFQVTRREDTFQGDLATWLRAPRGSVDSMLRYYSVWARQRHVPQAFLLFRYEDVRENAPRELRRIAEFIGLHDVSEAAIARAVDFASLRADAPARSSATGGRHAAGAGTTGRPGIVQGAPRQGGWLRRVPERPTTPRGSRAACAPSSIPFMATELPRSHARPPSQAAVRRAR